MALSKFNSDFIPTISDSESDVPDLDSDEETSIDKTENTSTKGKKLKSRKKKEKKLTKAGKKDQEEEEDDDKEKEEGKTKDLNPDFVFSVDDLNANAGFDGWEFDIEDNYKGQRKDVDLDGIIKRKGGLTGKVPFSAREENETDTKTEDEREDEGENEDNNSGDSIDEGSKSVDEDELALDGFGMGASTGNFRKTDEKEKNKYGEMKDRNEEEEEELEEEEEEEEEEENKTFDTQGKDKMNGNLNMGDVSDDENAEEDSAEAIADFYNQDDGEDAKKQLFVDFQSMKLSRPVLKGLSALGYTKPSPIQSASIPIALMGKDIVAGAVTGSGKTAAYMIPIIERLLYKPAKVASTKVIVLAPTRELAIQVAEVGKKIGQFVSGLTFGLAVGGLNLRQQEQELKKRPDVVIATPGRFIDHVRNSPSFNVDDVEIVVMDEADRMLEEGFEKEMEEIVQLLPTKRQTMLFSATMNSSIKQLISWSLNKPVRIMIDPPKAAACGLVQEFIRIRKREKLKSALLYTVLAKLDLKQRIIVFVSTKDMAHKLRIVLGLLGLKVGELHGGLSQEQRLKSVTDFKKLVVPILICTDLAARGLDIPKIEVVINYDMPKSHEIYLHRVGRTARAGREGVSISFVGESKKDRSIVKEVIKQIELDKKAGKAVGRNVDWNEIEKVSNVVDVKGDVINEILMEEKQEKEVLAAEMEIKKGENMLKYEDEIKSRPKRTWFMNEKEKSQEKNRLMENIVGKTKKVNSKKRKREEAMEEVGRSYKKTGKDRKDNDMKRINKTKSKNGDRKGGKKGGRRY